MNIIYLHWLILAVVLITAEMLVPGAYLLWMGIAAAIVSLVTYLFPASPFLLDVLVFAISSLAIVMLYRLYSGNNPFVTDLPTLNRRGEQYIGRTLCLEKAVVKGVGKVNIDDNLWKVRSSQDCPAGSSINVIAVDDTVLIVEPIL